MRPNGKSFDMNQYDTLNGVPSSSTLVHINPARTNPGYNYVSQRVIYGHFHTARGGGGCKLMWIASGAVRLAVTSSLRP